MPVNAADSAKCEVWHGAFSLTQCQKCCSGKSPQPLHLGTHTCANGQAHTPSCQGPISSHGLEVTSLITGSNIYVLFLPILNQMAYPDTSFKVLSLYNLQPCPLYLSGHFLDTLPSFKGCPCGKIQVLWRNNFHLNAALITSLHFTFNRF